MPRRAPRPRQRSNPSFVPRGPPGRRRPATPTGGFRHRLISDAPPGRGDAERKRKPVMKPEPPAARDSAGTFPVALLPRICQRAVPVTFRTPILALLPALCLAACSGTGGDTAGETAAAALGPDAVGDFRMKSGDPLTGDHDQSKIEAKYGSFSSYSTGRTASRLGRARNSPASNATTPSSRAAGTTRNTRPGNTGRNPGGVIATT